MVNKLDWHTREQTLILIGTLDRDTLPILWQQHQILLDGVYFLDLSNLERIDSAGLALILYFYNYQQQLGHTLILTGITDQLRNLIILYKLQDILIYL